MNEEEHELYEQIQRRNDKAASYDKPVMCPCKLTVCSLHYWDEYSNSFRIKVMK